MCSICLYDDENFKLRCGHSFHRECIKSWYLKGDSGKKCPICRKIIYISKWNKEREEIQKKELWESYVNEIIDSYNDLFQEMPELYEYISESIFDDLLCLEWMFDLNIITTEENNVNDQDFIIKYSDISNFDKFLFIGDHPYDIIATKTSYTTLNNLLHFWS